MITEAELLNLTVRHHSTQGELLQALQNCLGQLEQKDQVIKELQDRLKEIEGEVTNESSDT